jgi:FkbM family methyltransferase
MRLLYRAILKQLMQSTVQSHRNAGRPALAGYAFDHITVKMHLDGRFADHELATLEQRLFPQLDRAGVCLDIGANIGNHAVNFADYFAHVHAFEPNSKALDLLHINAKLRENITVHPLGLSDRTQTIEVAQPTHNLGGTGTSANGNLDGTRVKLPLVALDSLDLELDGQHIAFVKIDVEGAEADVIKGAARTLTAHRPVLGMEVDRRSVNGGSSPAISAALDLGYSHMYAMPRGRSMRIRQVGRAAARNYPLLILSMDPLLF